MKKNLSARIAQRANKKKPSRNAQNRAAFLAVRIDIKQALNDGWPIKSIWETLYDERKVTCSYQAFLGYVHQLILAVKTEVVRSSICNTNNKANQKSLEIPSFTFQPNLDKKDLL